MKHLHITPHNTFQLSYLSSYNALQIDARKVLQQMQSIGSKIKSINPITFSLRLSLFTILFLATLTSNNTMAQRNPTLPLTIVGTEIDCTNRDFMDDPLCESGFGAHARLRGRWTNVSNFELISEMVFFGSYDGTPVSGDGLVTPCGKPSSKGGLNQVTISGIKVSISGNFTRKTWDAIATKAQEEYGGLLAYDGEIGVYFKIPYKVYGITTVLTALIPMSRNTSVYEAVMNHVNFKPTESKVEEFACGVSGTA